MELKSLLVDVKTAWVEFPGLEGFEVELANLSRKELVNLRKNCSSNKFNRKTRVSKSYTGSISGTVFDILRNELGSLQDINVEPTLGIRKIVVPNNHPYTIINQLKKEAISKEYGSPHYVFFENKLGF